MSLTSGRWSMVLTGEDGEIIEAENLELTISTECDYETDIVVNMQYHRDARRQVCFTLHQYQGEVKLTLPKPKVEVGSTVKDVASDGPVTYKVLHIHNERAFIANDDGNGPAITALLEYLEVVQ